MTEDDFRLLRAEVQKLADIEDIKQLRARYTRWIDTKDWDALRGELTEDFHADTEGGVLDGREAFIGSLSQSLRGLEAVVGDEDKSGADRGMGPEAAQQLLQHAFAALVTRMGLA